MANGKNWNSKTKEWTELVRPETKEKARRAQELKAKGLRNTDIASVMGLSPARIRELLRS